MNILNTAHLGGEQAKAPLNDRRSLLFGKKTGNWLQPVNKQPLE